MESLFEQLGGTYTRQATIACRMFAYRPKKNAPSAFTGSGGELI